MSDTLPEESESRNRHLMFTPLGFRIFLKVHELQWLEAAE